MEKLDKDSKPKIMNGYKYTKVFEVNNRLVVADTIEEAIVVFKLFAPDEDIRQICQVSSAGDPLENPLNFYAITQESEESCPNLVSCP